MLSHMTSTQPNLVSHEHASASVEFSPLELNPFFFGGGTTWNKYKMFFAA